MMSSRPRRPTYLVAALVVAWILGVGGIMGGCETLRYYRGPDTTAVEAHKPTEEGMARYFAEQWRATREAQVKALDEYRDRMIPLAVANVVLSSLLVVACARALASKFNAHNLALQAVAATILYTIVDCFVSDPMRHAMITAAAAIPAPSAPQPADPAEITATISAVSWAGRMVFAVKVGVLGLVAYALTRPNVVAFFQYVNRDRQSDEA